MILGSRIIKQATILFIFIVLLGGFGFLSMRLISPPVPTPTFDPRSLLSPIEVIGSYFFGSFDQDYDVLVKVRNPNSEYGSGNIRYALYAIFDDNTREQSLSGSFYILPGQTQNLVFSPIKTTRQAVRFELQVFGEDWKKLDHLSENAVHFVIQNLSLSFSGVLPITKIGGNVLNDTDFDIEKVEVVGILYDASGAPVGVNRTDLRSFRARTLRGFEMSWTRPLLGKPVREYAEVHVNVFENDNFINLYVSQPNALDNP